ncbi:MAG: hypothetical protein ACP5TO_07995 [Thermoplasmata archaeon]
MHSNHKRGGKSETFRFEGSFKVNGSLVIIVKSVKSANGRIFNENLILILLILIIILIGINVYIWRKKKMIF